MSGLGPTRRASSVPATRRPPRPSPSPSTPVSFRTPSDNDKVWKDWFQKKIEERTRSIEIRGKFSRNIQEVSSIVKAKNYQTFYLFETIETQSDGKYSKKLEFGQVYSELSKLTGIQTITIKDASGSSEQMIVGKPAMKTFRDGNETKKRNVLLYDGKNLTFPGAWYLWLAREKRGPPPESARKGGKPYAVFLAAQFLESLKKKNNSQLEAILGIWKLTLGSFKIGGTNYETVKSSTQKAYTKKTGEAEEEEKDIDVWSIFEQAGCHVEEKRKKDDAPKQVLYLKSSVNPTYILPQEEPFSNLLELVKQKQRDLEDHYKAEFEADLRTNNSLQMVISNLPCLPPANYLMGEAYKNLPGHQGRKVDDPMERVISQIKEATKGLLKEIVFDDAKEELGDTEAQRALEQRAAKHAEDTRKNAAAATHASQAQDYSNPIY